MSQTSNILASESWAIGRFIARGFKTKPIWPHYSALLFIAPLGMRISANQRGSAGQVSGNLPKNLPEEALEKLRLRATRTPQHPDGLSFFNTSKMDLSTLDETGIKANLENYIQGFSKDAREIFEHFKFMDFMALLNDANY